MKPNSPPSLNDLLTAFKAEIFRDLNCVQPGRIEVFNPTNQTATIRLAIKHVVDELPDGTRILRERPLLVACPVYVMSGGMGYITTPIAKDDTCIVLFNDREIDNWFLSGGVQAPTTDRAHDLSDAIAIVGIRNTQNAIASYVTDAIEIHYASTSLFVGDGEVVSTAPLTAPVLNAGNGATGSFDRVTVVNGIVIGGS